MSGSKKGFIFSLEAMLALAILSLLLIMLVSMILSVGGRSVRPDSLSLLASDLLSAGDSLGILQDETLLQQHVSSVLPAQYCVRIDLLDEGGTLAFSYALPGCEDMPPHVKISYRTFVDGGKIYLARAWMWYRA